VELLEHFDCSTSLIAIFRRYKVLGLSWFEKRHSGETGDGESWYMSDRINR
jgi:hypothetical protein